MRTFLTLASHFSCRNVGFTEAHTVSALSGSLSGKRKPFRSSESIPFTSISSPLQTDSSTSSRLERFPWNRKPTGLHQILCAMLCKVKCFLGFITKQKQSTWFERKKATKGPATLIEEDQLDIQLETWGWKRKWWRDEDVASIASSRDNLGEAICKILTTAIFQVFLRQVYFYLFIYFFILTRIQTIAAITDMNQPKVNNSPGNSGLPGMLETSSHHRTPWGQDQLVDQHQWC